MKITGIKIDAMVMMVASSYRGETWLVNERILLDTQKMMHLDSHYPNVQWCEMTVSFGLKLITIMPCG